MKYIFGHSPSADPHEFPTKDRAIGYLRTELPGERRFRYRTTYNLRLVESIIFSFGGELLAELVVAGAEDPTGKDQEAYGKTRKVYFISEIRLFRDRTSKAADFGLTHSQFGIQVSDEVYARIIEKVGGFEQIIRNQSSMRPPPPAGQAGQPFLGSAPPPSPPPNTQEASDLSEPPAERVATTTYRVLRDTELARRVKVMHGYECQICGHTIQVPDGTRYAEAHHIQPLGSPHKGPDVIGNILCLCPNHHAEFDLGVTAISLSALRQFDGHAVDLRYVEYHNRQIHKPGNA